MPRIARLLIPLSIAALLAGPPSTAAAGSGPSLYLRLRHENVDDAALARRAEATTYRLRLGHLFEISPRWSGFLEAEHTGHLFGERYNSTANGAAGFPTVADPDNTELNQAWARLRQGPLAATLGRQRLNLGNQRFVGAVGWRQNEQTFDALDLQFAFDGPSLRYVYLDRVNRVFGAEHPNPLLARWDLDTHVVEATTTLGPGRLAILGLWLDNRSLPDASHRNLGLRYEGSLSIGEAPALDFVAEFAQQRPHADGLGGNRANFTSAELGTRLAAGQFRIGLERLGGDGRYAFQTPLATLHAFNGWADRFLTTPPHGLRDLWLGWNRGFGSVMASLRLHRFEADQGGARYGDELDASLGWKVDAQWNVLFKVAHYRSEGFASDVDKAWVSVEYAF
ncbi:alginate export family protein [Pseudomarimonas salicorniae]|uniref:Alginate export family protein n=1 Tax=Pseudomarimonas salicorniae TaxID=2933270 RepID=A0ABT0GDN7_9GAMM|nr:alginate export family protein [Lysobacter sp. CAU 1642]MCK7592669.1 alginate export family protein [Lysobacter sp. CAU 1642]